MSEGTTQDLTQSESNAINDFHDSQEDSEEHGECIATLEFKDTVRGEEQDLALYPGWDILVGREHHDMPPMPGKTLKQFAIHDARISKRHFRIYSIIYEQNHGCDTQSESLPPLIYCEDLESSNGTYVNGDLIGIIGKEKVAHLLCDGDVIELRPNWKFTFQQSNHQMIFPSSLQSKDIEHFVDRYTVSDRILGSGQFGKVYLAKELSTNRQIACKIVDLDSAMRSVAKDRPDRSGTGTLWKSGLDSARQHRKKVLLEIDILSKLSHPNIINIRRAFCSHHSLYILTDLAPAGDLFSYAQTHGGHLDDYNTRVIIKQITLALEYMHSQGIAHRDIKSENVLVTSTDFGGRVMLTDFGFATYATAINGRMVRMLSKVGTPGFVAPEVENVENMALGYTKAADLWSLGVMTASLLTGTLKMPHEELSQLSLELSEVNPTKRFLELDDSYARHHWIKMAPRALRFVRKLLVKDPERRMTAAEALEHSWYTKPAREAQALDEGLQRINRFWQKRKITSEEVLEALPGPGIVSPIAKEVTGPRFRKKIPDATSSPYFGLDRHLNQKAPSGRKRLLDDLNESGSPFLTSHATQRKPVTNLGAQRVKGKNRVVSVDGTDLFGMSPQKKDISQSGGDFGIDVVDLTVDISDPSSEYEDLTPATFIPCTNKQLSSSMSSSIRPSLGTARTDGPKSRSLFGGKRCRVSRAEAWIHDLTPKESPRYTTAEALRTSVGRMKL